jgi:hypothetical protein
MAETMAGYIARAIMKAETNSGTGAALYRAYFISINTWEKYRADVDIILIAEGYAQCIVTA